VKVSILPFWISKGKRGYMAGRRKLIARLAEMLERQIGMGAEFAAASHQVEFSA
jgi:hypothetical protein